MSNNPVRVFWVDVASVGGIAVLWPALLLLLAGAPVSVEQSALDPAPLAGTTRYVMRIAGAKGSAWSGTVIPLPSENGFSSELRDETVGVESLNPLRIDMASPLKRDLFKSELPAEAIYADFAARLIRPINADGNAPMVPTSPAFVRMSRNGTGTKMSVASSGDLQKRDFAPGSFVDAGLPDIAEPWEIRATVELAANGKVAHAFLEEPTGNNKIDAAVVRALLCGLARPASTACRGTFVISKPRSNPRTADK
jgi:hypothetical protein